MVVVQGVMLEVMLEVLKVVVAAMMEGMVIKVMFTVTAAIVKTDSPGPSISQTSSVFATHSLPVSCPREARRGRALTRPDRAALYLELIENI